MTTLLAESTGRLSIAVSEKRPSEFAFKSAAEIVECGETLIVVDTAGCFEPTRMTHSARIGAIDPVNLMKRLHILRTGSAADLEHLVLYQLEQAMDKLSTRHVLFPDLLTTLYDPQIPTRDAARILGRVKARLEELVSNGAQIVLLCRQAGPELGTRAHFLSSLCTAADRVYFRNST